MSKAKSLKSILTLAGLSSLALAPVFVNSCSQFKIDEGEIGRQEQIAILSSEEAKQQVLDAWLTKTYTSLYAFEILNNPAQQIELEYYLNNLCWNPNATIEQAQKTKFENLVFDTFKFYVTFKSTINSSSTTNDANKYFFNKANEWKTKEFVSIDGSVSIADFNPGFRYLPPAQKPGSEFEKFKKDFQILMKVRGTAVYSEILKLLITQMYFLHSNESQILKGTNYEKLTRNVSSVDYINAKSFDIKDRLYFLLKYLVESNPRFEWGFTSSDYKTSTVQNAAISTIQQYNNINPTIVRNIWETIAPLSPDTTVENNVNSSMIHGYNGLILQSENNNGDLSNNIDEIKTFGDDKVGLLDTTSNKLYSFTELEAINVLKDLKTSSNAKVGVPSINVKEASKEKITKQLTVEDFDMIFDNNRATYDQVSKTLSLSLNDTYKQKWTLEKIAFASQTDTERKIHLSVKYEFEANAKQYKMNYEFDILDWNKGIEQSINPFKVQYEFTQDNSEAAKMFPSNISILKDSQPLGITYVLRILPKFIQTGATTPIGDFSYMIGQFTLNNTIWTDPQNNQDDKALINLSNLFMMSDSSLWAKIQDYYLFNDFNIESTQQETIQIINSLGLTKKTNEERANAGLPVK